LTGLLNVTNQFKLIQATTSTWEKDGFTLSGTSPNAENLLGVVGEVLENNLVYTYADLGPSQPLKQSYKLYWPTGDMTPSEYVASTWTLNYTMGPSSRAQYRVREALWGSTSFDHPGLELKTMSFGPFSPS